MRRATPTLALFIVSLLAGCLASRERPQPVAELDFSEPAEDGALPALEGPDGWTYAGVRDETGAARLVAENDDQRYVSPPGDWEHFVPTLGGNVFARDASGAWWRVHRGERLARMPWRDFDPAGVVERGGEGFVGTWSAELESGGWAKVDATGAVVEAYPTAVRLERVGPSWILEHEGGRVDVEAPDGDPLLGGTRYERPGAGFLVHFSDDRLIFDPRTLGIARMDSVPSVRVLASPDGVLLGLVPSFEDDPTVALYDYYAGRTTLTKQHRVEAVRVREPFDSPHVAAGEQPFVLDAVVAFDADGDVWSAYELIAVDPSAEGRRDWRLECVLRGRGDLAHARRVLEAELVARHSRALAPE